MKKTAFFALLLSLSLAAPAFAQQSLDAMIDREIAQLVTTYKMLHAAPELSHYEIKTSAFFAAQLRALGYEVTENVGKFSQPLEAVRAKLFSVQFDRRNQAAPAVVGGFRDLGANPADRI